MGEKVTRRAVGDVVDISRGRRAEIVGVGRIGYTVLVVSGSDEGMELFRHEFEVFDPEEGGD